MLAAAVLLLGEVDEISGAADRRRKFAGDVGRFIIKPESPDHGSATLPLLPTMHRGCSFKKDPWCVPRFAHFGLALWHRYLNLSLARLDESFL